MNQAVISGYVKIYELPPDIDYLEARKLIDKNPEKYLRVDGPNKIVSVGTSLIIDLLLGTSTSDIDYVSVGTSSTAVQSSDTDVIGNIAPRHAITNKYRSGVTANFDTFFSSSENNGTWEESGLHTAITSGTMLARKLTGTFVKSTANTALLAWVVTVTAV